MGVTSSRSLLPESSQAPGGGAAGFIADVLSYQGLRGPAKFISAFAQIAAAAILAQTLFFKFTGAAEAKYIFTTLGVEPWGRIGTGIFELIAVVLLLVPRTAIFGAALTVGLMVGAIGSHLTKLGIVVLDDGGLLFGLGIAALMLSLAILATRHTQVLHVVRSTLRRLKLGVQ